MTWPRASKVAALSATLVPMTEAVRFRIRKWLSYLEKSAASNPKLNGGCGNGIRNSLDD
jgi:hypothetical protein